MNELFDNVPAAALLALLFPAVGRAIKASPLPDWLIPYLMAAVGAGALLFLPAAELGLGDRSAAYRVILGVLAGLASVGLNQAWRQTGKRLIDGPEQPAAEPEPPRVELK